MGSWPFTRLHIGRGRCIAISGPYIQVLDASSGQIQHVTRCASLISCSAVDETYSHLATTGDDKVLHVWELDHLQLKSSRELPKKATVVRLSPDGQTILVADKFGDVFSYPLDPPTETIPVPAHAMGPRPRDSQMSHENPLGTLVLGHASIITSLLLSPDGRHIITGDRDEHIRVSRYPHGYIIERYCLGHQLYVSTLCIPTFEPTSLVSGGGDPSLNIWDWMSGTLKCQIPIADAVKPFLRARGSKSKWHGEAGTRGRKGRGRGKKETQMGVVMGAVMEVDETIESPTVPTTFEQEPTIVLTKLEAFEFNNQKLLVFSATGGSAIFYCAYPSQASDIPPVRHIDFSKPILDFVLGNNCQVLVSIDAAWSTENRVNAAVRLVEWRDNEFTIVDEPSSLLTSLNTAGLQEASATELASLDLYADLTLLPKHADGPDDGDGAGGQESDMRPDTPEGSHNDTKKHHAKVAGRLKTKQALLRRQKLEQRGSRSVSGDEREAKKIKLDQVE